MQVRFALPDSAVESYDMDSPPREGEKVQFEIGGKVRKYTVQSVEWEMYDENEVLVSVGME